MKKRISLSILTASLMVLASCGNKTNSTMETDKSPLFGLGDQIEQNFTGRAWLNNLSVVPANDCNVYNVTFEPGVRNSWHSHAVGQILLCTDGIGYYQEKGGVARRLEPGDVVNIPANIEHWHGAAPDSRFSHVGITPKVGENITVWGAPVTEEEYAEAVK